MNLVSVLCAVATIFAAGFGAQALLASRPPQFNLAEQFALSWLLGASLISLLIWTLGFFVSGTLLPALVFGIALALGLTGFNRSRNFPVQFSPNFSAAECLLALLIVGQFALLIYLSFVHTLGWDGLFNWEIKARYAYLNGGVLPVEYLRDSGRGFSHPEYPLCIPFTELWLYFWLGEPHQFWAKIIFPIFYLAGVLLVGAFSARFTGRRIIGLMSAALLFFVPQISVASGSSIVGYADFPMSVLYLAAIGFLVRAGDENDPSCFRAYAVCLIFLPWLKREGVILWAIAAFCGALVIIWSRRPRRELLMLLPGLLIILAWSSYLSATHAARSGDFLPATMTNLRAHLDRVGPIASAAAASFHEPRVWGIFWFLVVYGCVSLLRSIWQPRVAVLLIALCAPLIVYFSVYIFSAWPDYLAHLRFSITRLTMHVAPLAWVAVAIAIAGSSRREKGEPHTAPTCVQPDPERTPAVEFA